MRVLLLCPPASLDAPIAPRHPPHVTAIVAGALREAGHEVALLDHHVGHPGAERVQRDVASSGAEAILITLVDDNRHVAAAELARYAALVRSAAPDARLAGFGLINEARTQALREQVTSVDIVLGGQPDQTAAAWVTGAPLPSIAPGGDAALRAAVPAWDLVDLDSYPYSPHQQTPDRVFPVLASRGCPFPCFFCETNEQPRWAARSVDDVVAEIQVLHQRYGTRSVFFADPHLAVDRGWTLALCDALRRDGPDGLVWSGQVRPDAVDAELMGAMAAAGCWNLIMGVESLDPEVLRATGKNLDPALVAPAVSAARAAGIEVIASAMIGLPGDSPTGFRRTLMGLIDAEPDYAQFFVVRLRGDEAPSDGGFVGDWEGGDSKNFQGRTWASSGFDGDDQVLELQREAYRRFYLRPRYVRRRIMRLARHDRPLSELRRNLAGAALAARLVLGRNA